MKSFPSTVAARRPSRSMTAVCNECVISPSSAQYSNAERVADALDPRRVAGEEMPAGPAGAFSRGVGRQHRRRVVFRIEGDREQHQVAVHARGEPIADRPEVGHHPRAVVGQRTARVDEGDGDDFPLQRRQGHGSVRLIGQLEIRHRRSDRNQHGPGRRLLQTRIDRRGGDHVDRGRPTIVRPSRRVENARGRPASSPHARAEPLTSKGMAIASMNPGNASCEMVTVDAGSIDVEDEAGGGVVMRARDRSKNAGRRHETDESTKEQSCLFVLSRISWLTPSAVNPRAPRPSSPPPVILPPAATISASRSIGTCGTCTNFDTTPAVSSIFSCCIRNVNRSSSDWPIARRARLADAPHPPLERADRLLARLVDELLLGVLRLPLFGRVLANPGVHLGLQIGRELRVLVDHVLEIGREMDLAGAGARERVERLGRQRRRAVLHGAAEPVVLSRATRDSSSSVLQIDLHVGPHACRRR